MDFREVRVGAAGIAVLGGLALLAPAPAAPWILGLCALLLLIGVVTGVPVLGLLFRLTPGAKRNGQFRTVGARRVRATQGVALAFTAGALIAEVAGSHTATEMFVAALVSSSVLFVTCGYCISQDLYAAWRRVGAH